jgi:hypothetical protein
MQLPCTVILLPRRLSGDGVNSPFDIAPRPWLQKPGVHHRNLGPMIRRLNDSSAGGS